MNEQTIQRLEAFENELPQEDVVLNLTLTGARECILDLLDQMDTVEGFSVLEGSFTTRFEEHAIH